MLDNESHNGSRCDNEVIEQRLRQSSQAITKSKPDSTNQTKTGFVSHSLQKKD